MSTLTYNCSSIVKKKRRKIKKERYKKEEKQTVNKKPKQPKKSYYSYKGLNLHLNVNMVYDRNAALIPIVVKPPFNFVV